jgi:formylglycine-generating enzyme required for sulfatase activity
VLRGGSWDSLANGCRSASRIVIPPVLRYVTYGFRLVAARIS